MSKVDFEARILTTPMQTYSTSYYHSNTSEFTEGLVLARGKTVGKHLDTYRLYLTQTLGHPVDQKIEMQAIDADTRTYYNDRRFPDGALKQREQGGVSYDYTGESTLDYSGETWVRKGKETYSNRQEYTIRGQDRDYPQPPKDSGEEDDIDSDGEEEIRRRQFMPLITFYTTERFKTYQAASTYTTKISTKSFYTTQIQAGNLKANTILTSRVFMTRKSTAPFTLDTIVITSDEGLRPQYEVDEWRGGIRRKLLAEGYPQLQATSPLQMEIKAYGKNKILFPIGEHESTQECHKKWGKASKVIVNALAPTQTEDFAGNYSYSIEYDDSAETLTDTVLTKHGIHIGINKFLYSTYSHGTKREEIKNQLKRGKTYVYDEVDDLNYLNELYYLDDQTEYFLGGEFGTRETLHIDIRHEHSLDNAFKIGGMRTGIQTINPDQVSSHVHVELTAGENQKVTIKTPFNSKNSLAYHLQGPRESFTSSTEDGEPEDTNTMSNGFTEKQLSIGQFQYWHPQQGLSRHKAINFKNLYPVPVLNAEAAENSTHIFSHGLDAKKYLTFVGEKFATHAVNKPLHIPTTRYLLVRDGEMPYSKTHETTYGNTISYRSTQAGNVARPNEVGFHMSPKSESYRIYEGSLTTQERENNTGAWKTITIDIAVSRLNQREFSDRTDAELFFSNVTFSEFTYQRQTTVSTEEQKVLTTVTTSWWKYSTNSISDISITGNADGRNFQIASFKLANTETESQSPLSGTIWTDVKHQLENPAQLMLTSHEAPLYDGGYAILSNLPIQQGGRIMFASIGMPAAGLAGNEFLQLSEHPCAFGSVIGGVNPDGGYDTGLIGNPMGKPASIAIFSTEDVDGTIRTISTFEDIFTSTIHNSQDDPDEGTPKLTPIYARNVMHHDWTIVDKKSAELSAGIPLFFSYETYTPRSWSNSNILMGSKHPEYLPIGAIYKEGVITKKGEPFTYEEKSVDALGNTEYSYVQPKPPETEEYKSYMIKVVRNEHDRIWTQGVYSTKLGLI